MSLTLLKYAEKFLEYRVNAEVFSNTYILLWKIERDEGITFQDNGSLSLCLSSIFTASDAFEPEEGRQESELSEDQFRKEVAEHIKKYEVEKKKQKIAFEIELLYRVTNTNTGIVELVSKIYVILRDNYEDAKKDSIKILNDKIENRAVFGNDEGHIIQQDPVEVVSVTKSGSLGADWMIEAALGDFGYKVRDVKHLSPEDLPIDRKEKKNEKIAFKLQLLYRWTNSETGYIELASKIFIILRDSYEEAQREAIEFLTDTDTRFRNNDGVVIQQDPVEVVSVTHLGSAGADWIITSALETYGYEAGVVRHRIPDDLPLA